MAKSKKVPIPDAGTLSLLQQVGGTEPMTRFVSDVKGPVTYWSKDQKKSIPVADITMRYRYFITFTDLISGWSRVYGMTSYADIVPSTAKFLQGVTRNGHRPRMLRSDNFSNYRSAAMRELLDHYNMEQQFIVPYCSWMIGKAEKLNHTLWSAATALLYVARLEPCF